MSRRRRLDVELVRRGLFPSREQARRAVADGQVLVAGVPAATPSRLVDPAEALTMRGPAARFVGRGGEKLDGALDRFGVDVTGLRVLDAGASTGGFTDCLLQRGAAAVVAVDVGRGQLHQRLRADPRVEVRERCNVRDLRPGDLGPPVDAVVADLSFISLRLVLGALAGLAEPGAPLVALVKPQFEAGREVMRRTGGVVRDPAVWADVLGTLDEALVETGAVVRGWAPSPLRGADGNTEFFVWADLPGAHLGAPGARAGGPAPDGPPVPEHLTRAAALAEAEARQAEVRQVEGGRAEPGAGAGIRGAAAAPSTAGAAPAASTGGMRS